MNQTIFGNLRRVRRLPLVIFVFSLLLALLILGGCEKRNRDAHGKREPYGDSGAVGIRYRLTPADGK